jgi:micrococcal nuclease
MWENWGLLPWIGEYLSLKEKLLKLVWRLCIFCCCLLLVGCQATRHPNTISVQVQRVLSGQTLEVFNPAQQPTVIWRVRLIGIEAPDMKQQPWGVLAKNRLEQLLTSKNGQQVILLEPDQQQQDIYKRWLAYVWRNDVLINEQLVKEGYVLAAPRLPNKKYDSKLMRAQEYARLMGYGIWNPDQPMRLTPAEFRRQNS